MSYTVVGYASRGPVSSLHDADEDAFTRSVALMADGLREVHIISPDGQRFTPSEFARRLSGPDGSDEDGIEGSDEAGF